MASSYDKLVKALLHCSGTPYARCSNCPMHDKGVADYATPCGILSDAADAIEALQAEVKDAFNEGYNAGYTAGIGYCSFKRAKMEVQE